MEVQGGKYARLVRAAKHLPLEESGATKPGRITIQQKGLNDFDRLAAASYVRIMVETFPGNAGDFETLYAEYQPGSDELAEVFRLFRVEVESNAESVSSKIVEWDPPSVEVVNGMQSIRLSYRRRYDDNPPARVTTFLFQNHDRMHSLTMAYRESERDRWLRNLARILSSFRITNIRGEAASGARGLAPVLRDPIEQTEQVEHRLEAGECALSSSARERSVDSVPAGLGLTHERVDYRSQPKYSGKRITGAGGRRAGEMAGLLMLMLCWAGGSYLAKLERLSRRRRILRRLHEALDAEELRDARLALADLKQYTARAVDEIRRDAKDQASLNWPGAERDDETWAEQLEEYERRVERLENRIGA
jgi:hypothetical protein